MSQDFQRWRRERLCAASDFPLKTRFIVNPRSGRARQALPAIQAFAARTGADVVATQRPRHAAELAREAQHAACNLVVAVGGDGTMNEIAGVLSGTGVILGLIPCGSGDGLGRHLGIHGSIERALDVLHTGRPHDIDTGFADGHAFFTAAGIGFEAEIAQRFNHLQRRGFARYLSTSARAYRDWQPQDYIVTHGSHRESVRAFTLAVANANQYGNNALISPAARIDDGLLDLCVIPPVRWFNVVPLATRLFRGTIAHASGVRLLRSDHFLVERAVPGPLHTDGEVHAAGTRLEFRIRPRSLRVMIPSA